MNRWIRRLIIIGAIASIVALAAVLAVRWWGQVRLSQAVSTFEREVGRLDSGRFELAALEDAQNAAVWLVAGSQASVIPERLGVALREGLSLPPDEWGPELVGDLEELIEINLPSFELLERSLPIEDSTFGIRYSQGFDAEIPPVLELWRVGRLIRLDSRMALLDGDRARLDRDIALLDRMAEALAKESFLITALTAISLDGLLISIVYDVVQGIEADVDLLTDLQSRLSSRDSTDTMGRALASGAVATANTPIDKFESGDQSIAARYFSRLLAPIGLANLLDEYAEMWGLLSEPFATIREFYFSENGLAAWNVYGILMPNLLDAIGKAKAVETARVLALRAVGARLTCLDRGYYPESFTIKGDDSYAGGSIEIEKTRDGALNLTAPQALDLWSEVYEEGSSVQAPPLSWRLPSCGESSS